MYKRQGRARVVGRRDGLDVGRLPGSGELVDQSAVQAHEGRNGVADLERRRRAVAVVVVDVFGDLMRQELGGPELPTRTDGAGVEAGLELQLRSNEAG